MSEDVDRLIWETTQKNHENYLRHYILLHKIPPRERWTPVDEALYGVNDLFHVKAEEADRLRLEAIKYSFNYNYAHNRFYHNVCEQRGTKPEDIQKYEDLVKIPLIPQRIFKQYPEPERFIPWLRGISSDTIKYPRIEGSSYIEIIEKLNQYGMKVIFSSGTTGNSTILPRDQITLMREVHFREQFRRFEGHNSDGCYFSLGLDIRKIHPNWGIAHSLGGDVTIMHAEDQINYALNIEATPDKIKTLMGVGKGKTQIEKQAKGEVEARRIHLLDSLRRKWVKGELHGAPYMINDFLTEIEASGTDLWLGDGWTVGTGGGGWLGINQEDLWSRIERLLGIPSKNCRDVYGITENVLCFPSCEGHYYHIPHTLIQPFVLDDNLEPLGFGESGRFAFIDPVSNAYPGYIITEDKITLLENCPFCGRLGPVICPAISRMPGLEDGGCSAMMKKLMRNEVSML